MGTRRSGTVGGADLLDRIGFDTELEAEGLRRLAALDVGACRTQLGRLAGELRLGGLDGRQRDVVALLADVLLQVNRCLHGTDPRDPTYRFERLALIERFAAHETAAAAREDFLPALNGLLAPLGGGDRREHGVVERARRYIDASYHQRIFLSSVALALSVSPNYLSRLFREEVGITLTAYIQQRRVERARVLLAEGRHSLAEIAYRVGYRHYRDFYRNFVKIEGASPRQARTRLRRPVAAPKIAAES